MSFIEIFIKWIILVLITALILYCVFYYMFGWFNNEEIQSNEEIKQQKNRKNIVTII